MLLSPTTKTPPPEFTYTSTNDNTPRPHRFTEQQEILLKNALLALNGDGAPGGVAGGGIFCFSVSEGEEADKSINVEKTAQTRQYP